MTSEGFWQVVRFRWTWLVAGLVIGLAVAGLALALLPKTYSSEASILVEAEMPDGDASGFSAATYISEQLPTYVDLGRADSVHQDIRERLGRDLGREEIGSRVAYAAAAGSAVLTVTGVGDPPEDAQGLSDAAATAISTAIEDTSTGSVDVSTTIVQRATLPSAPEDPDPLVLLPAGVLVGLAAPLLVALALAPRHQRGISS